MKVTVFAAIEIASYEVSMKIYELSQKTMREITCVRHRIELGKDAYRLGKISNERLEDITLEQGLLREKAEFFEDVFGVTPVLRRRKTR